MLSYFKLNFKEASSDHFSIIITYNFHIHDIGRHLLEPNAIVSLTSVIYSKTALKDRASS